MKYTITEICNILEIKPNTVWNWINKGIVSCHPRHEGEKVYLKAELCSGNGKRGGKYYVVEINDLNDFMVELYYTTYFYKWWRK